VLMYQPDPKAVLRTLADSLKPDGVMAFLELNVPAQRVVWPPSSLMSQVIEWANAALIATGVHQHMGVQLPELLRSVGMQPQPPYEAVGLVYHGCDAVTQATVSPMRSLIGALTEHGIASADEIDIDTLAERLRQECGTDPVLVTGTLLAVWTKKT
jgi:hypothetical protein